MKKIFTSFIWTSLTFSLSLILRWFYCNLPVRNGLITEQVEGSVEMSVPSGIRLYQCVYTIQKEEVLAFSLLFISP